MSAWLIAGGASVGLGLRLHGPWRYVFLAAGAELVRRGLTRQNQPEVKDKVDMMSEQSFPASDPPSY